MTHIGQKIIMHFFECLAEGKWSYLFSSLAAPRNILSIFLSI